MSKKLSDYLFYSDNWATIYCGDCREILPMLEPVDLVLTDPPYGINYRGGFVGGKSPKDWPAKFSKGCSIIGDDKAFDPTPFLDFPSVILWGANNYCRYLPQGQWLVWLKTRSTQRMLDQSDAELAWKKGGYAVYVFEHMWFGLCRDSEIAEPVLHPTQKPIALMKWCIEKSKNTKIILDPFLGSGTTCLAAKNLNRKSIGIEIEPKYCEVAVKRLRQEVFDFRGTNA